MSRLFSKILLVLNWFLKPVTRDLGFFLNLVLILIIPTLINVFFVSPEYYIHHSSSRLFGFYATRGASFPFILFVPSAVSYLINLFVLCVRKNIYNVIKIIFYIVFGSLFVANIFLLCNFKTMMSPTIITLIKETNSSESSDFFATYLFSSQSLIAYMLVIFSVFLFFLIEKLYKYINVIVEYKYIQPFVSLFVFYLLFRSFTAFTSYCKLFSFKQVVEVENWYMEGFPQECNMLTNIVYSFYIDFISKAEIEQSRSATIKCDDKPVSHFKTKLILVIGESFSKHHSSLYGYVRRTNPYLEQELKNGNLFVFNDVISPYNVTSNVMKNLFSTNSIMDGESWNSYPIFPYIFKKCGFDVYFWDNQKTTETDISDYAIFSYIYDKMVKQLSYTACNDSVFDYDMDFIKNFFSIVTNYAPKTLLMFHLKGQHAMAERKYPHTSEYMHFTTDSIKGDYTIKQKEQIAHYDNCTRYNDAVLRNLIDHVRNDNCVIVYFSDHGEEVHDYRDHYGRTQESVKTSNILKYQYQVPFMVWCSDSYKEKHPDIISNIFSAIDKPFMIDNTCQILFGLAGINSKFYYPNRNLISPNFKPYKKRVVQNSIEYEEIVVGD